MKLVRCKCEEVFFLRAWVLFDKNTFKEPGLANEY